VKAIYREQADLYLDEVAVLLQLRGFHPPQGGLFSVSQIHRVCAELGLSRKVIDERHSALDHIDRLRYFLEMAEVENADQFVFVDECSKNRASARRRYGRAALSERAIVFRDIYKTTRHS
jgi:hypothetical protein